VRSIAVTLLASILFLIGCRDSGPTKGSDITPQQRTMASQAMGVKFPAGAEALLYEYWSGLDDSLYLKVRMTTSDLETFLTQARFSGVEWENQGQQLRDMEGVPEWTPSGVGQYRFGEIELPSAEWIWVLIDDTYDDEHEVYFAWHQM
jgi:hypothetical protein